MKTLGVLLLGFMLAVPMPSYSNQSPHSNFPERTSPIYFKSADYVELEYNEPNTVRDEILQPSFLSELAVSLQLEPNDVKQIIMKRERNRVVLFQNGADGKTFNTIYKSARDYVNGRLEGHTKAFMASSMKSAASRQDANDPDLMFILKKFPNIPVGWLKKDVCTEPNIACQNYYLIDGSIAWRYQIVYGFAVRAKDGRERDLKKVYSEKADAKEYDEALWPIFEEVDRAVTEKMEKEGTAHHLGSCHTFWRLKKELLKQRGINWKSPAELNPKTRYD